MGSSPEEKDPRALVDEKLHMSHQCLQARKPNVSGCIKGSVASRLREGILLHCSTLLRPQLEHCFQLLGLQYKEDRIVKRRAIRMIRGLEDLSSSLRELWFVSLGGKRL